MELQLGRESFACPQGIMKYKFQKEADKISAMYVPCHHRNSAMVSLIYGRCLSFLQYYHAASCGSRCDQAQLDVSRGPAEC